MFKLSLYQMEKSKRWRWKLIRSNRCVARADHHWASKAAARRAFYNVILGASNHVVKNGNFVEV